MSALPSSLCAPPPRLQNPEQDSLLPGMGTTQPDPPRSSPPGCSEASYKQQTAALPAGSTTALSGWAVGADATLPGLPLGVWPDGLGALPACLPGVEANKVQHEYSKPCGGTSSFDPEDSGS